VTNPVSMALDVEGFTRALKRADTAVSGPILVSAVQLAAMVVQNAAKRNAPYVTGTLRRSIHQEVERLSSTFVQAIIGTDLHYARRVEFGFAGKDALGRVYNQAAKPYLRPAMDDNRAKISREFKKVLRIGLQNAGVI